MNINLSILVAGEAIAYCIMALVFAVSAAAGYLLAPSKALAMLPLITEIFGACLATVPAAYVMQRWGRRVGFVIGSLLGVLGAGLCAYAAYSANFWCLVLATPLLGAVSGFGEFARYAAADLFDDEKAKGRAMSLVVSSGIVAAFIGPALANWSNEHFVNLPQYVAPFMVCGVLSVLSLLLYSCLRIARAQALAGDAGQGVTEKLWSASVLSRLFKNPVFVLSIGATTIAYLVMSAVMDAMPMSMLDCGFSFSQTTYVLQWHMLAMFVPSFLTTRLMEKVGALPLIYAGIVLNALGLLIGLIGLDFHNFWLTLFCVGLGWNCMFIPGINLISKMSAADRAPAEGVSNLLIMVSFSVSGPVAAVLVANGGWHALTWLAAGFLLVAGGVALWFQHQKMILPR